MLLIFIISSKVFSLKLKSKWLDYIPLIIVLINLGLIIYYFPNTGLAKSIICTSQACLDEHATRNFDSRIVGEYINGLNGSVVYDSTDRTGLVGFYLDEYWKYMTGGIARLTVGGCPGMDVIRDNGFTHVINNTGCVSVILDDLVNCSYKSIYIRNYEMTQVYDIRGC
jgi:hypothetical protein